MKKWLHRDKNSGGVSFSAVNNRRPSFVLRSLAVFLLTFTSGYSRSDDEAFEMPAISAEQFQTGNDTVGPTDGLSMDEEEQVLTSPDGEDADREDGSADEEDFEIEKLPEIVKEVRAEYPSGIYGEGIQGTVVMDLLVDTAGRVDSVAVVEGVHPVLDSNAVAAVRQFQFTPAMAGGEPVSVILQYEYTYFLEEVVRDIEKYPNFTGQLLELGTRTPITDALVVVRFIDTAACDLSVPFDIYIERIGQFEGQYLEEGSLVTTTDSEGRFIFHSLPACSIEVSAPVVGFEEFGEKEQLRTSEQIEVTYRLRKISYSDLRMVVYGREEKKEVSRRQLQLQEVKKIPGLRGDAVRVVQALPGVARPSFGGGDVVVRGGGMGDSRYFLDGIEIPLLFHFGGLISTYNSDALETVDFYPGGWGTRYGNATAGIIEISSRPAEIDRWHGYLDANVLDGSLLVEGPVFGDKLSLLGSYRRSFIGEIATLVTKQFPNFPITTVVPYYWDYILRADYEIGEQNHAFLTFHGVQDGAELLVSGFRGGSKEVQEAQDAFKIKLLYHMGILGWDWNSAERWENEFRYSFSYQQYEAAAGGSFRTESNIWQQSLREQLSFIPSEKLRANVGLDVSVFPLDMLLYMPGNKNDLKKDTSTGWWFGNVGPYFNLEIRPIENLLITPGLRYDWYPELKHQGGWLPEFWDYEELENTTSLSGEPAFRISGRYEFMENHTAKASAGTYNQSPEPIGQTIHPTWGDPELPTTKAAQYVAGYEWQMTDLVRSDIQTYYNRQWNVPEIESNASLSRGETFGFTSSGRKRMYGLELLLRHDQSDRFFGWLAYSLSRTEHWDESMEQWELNDKDQTHNLIALGTWRLPKDFEVGFRFQYTSGDPYTPVTGKTYNENKRRYEADFGATNSGRLPPHIQLDLRFDKKFIFRKWILSAYVDFFNLGYFLYKSPQTYISPWDPYDYNKGEANIQTVYQYSIPAIGLKGEF